MLVGIATSVIVGFIAAESDALRLALGGLLGMVLCIGMAWDSAKRYSKSYCIGYMIASSAVGHLVFVLMGGAGVAWGGSGAYFNLMDKPWVMLLYMNLGLVITWVFGRLLYRKPRELRIPHLATQVTADIHCFERLALLALPLALGGTLSFYVPEYVRYVFEAAGAALNVLPFFVGRFVRKQRATFWVWIGALLLNGVVMAAAGGRWAAMLPIVLFGAGLMFRLPPRRAWIPVATAALLFVPALWMVAVLGVVRDDLGRGAHQVLSWGRIDRMIGTAQQVAAPGMTRELVLMGTNRMVAWANYATAILTPEVVPYRGFSTFPAEMKNAVSLYALSPEARDERAELEMGTLPAISYGYTVTDQTSVEWGVIADGWSRAGWWSAALFLVLACAPVLLLERRLLQTEIFRPAVKVIFIAFLMNRFMRAGSIPLLDLLRGLATNMLAYAVVLLALNMLLNAVFPWKKQAFDQARADLPLRARS